MTCEESTRNVWLAGGGDGTRGWTLLRSIPGELLPSPAKLHLLQPGLDLSMQNMVLLRNISDASHNKLGSSAF